MADNNIPVPRETYQGPDKASAAIGAYYKTAWQSSILTTILALPFAIPLFEEANKSHHLTFGEFISKNKGKVTALVALSLATIGVSIMSAVEGWNKAKTAEQQFNDMQDQRDAAMANSKIMGLENEAIKSHVGQMTHAFNEERRKFTDTIQSRHAEHAHGEIAPKEHAAEHKDHSGEHHAEHEKASSHAAQFEHLAAKDGHAAVAQARAEQVANATPQVA